MERFGPIGGSKHPAVGYFHNIDGTVRVLKEKCHNCPYRPNSSFNPQLKRIHKANQKDGGFNYCHNTYPSDVPDAICRGSYDAFIDRFTETPDFIDEPKSMYVVIPWDEG